MTREPPEPSHDLGRQLFDTLAELCPFAVVAVAPDGAVIGQNGAARELLGLAADAGPVARCLAGEHITDESLERAGPDGRPSHLQLRGAPVRDAAGTVAAAIITVVDVTEPRRRAAARRLLDDAARALSESLEVERILQLAAELGLPQLGDGCAVCTVEGDELLQHRAFAHVDPEVARRLRDGELTLPLESKVWDAIRDGRPLVDAVGDHPLGLRALLHVPLIARGRALGALRLFLTGGARRFDDLDLELARQLADRIALALDNARLYEEAQRAGQAREDVLTVVSHDLRNPLSAISLGTTVLVRKIRDAEENVAVIQRSAQRIERLVENLLDLASAQAGRPVTMEREVAEAAELVQEAVLLQKPLADKKGVKVAVDVEIGSAPLFCDRTRILQVFGNLLDNAIKFSSSGQVVTIRGDRVDHTVRFVVIDRGPGIGDADLPHIFEPYWSASRGGKKGLGLGLSIAKSIVDAHDGRMWATSDPNLGTCFYFTLPLADMS